MLLVGVWSYKAVGKQFDTMCQPEISVCIAFYPAFFLLELWISTFSMPKSPELSFKRQIPEP